MATKKKPASSKKSAKKAAPKKKPAKKAQSTKKKPVSRKTKAPVRTAKKPATKEKKARPSSQAKQQKSLPKPKEPRKELNIINLIQMFLEIIIASGFFIALVGETYKYIAWSWVLPLSLVCFILAIIEKNNSAWLAAICIPLAVIVWFPVVGTLSMIAGLLVSTMAAVGLISDLYM